MPLNKVTADSIADGTVIAADIANGAITGPKLGLTAINANNIVSASITSDKLVDSITIANTTTSSIANFLGPIFEQANVVTTGGLTSSITVPTTGPGILVYTANSAANATVNFTGLGTTLAVGNVASYVFMVPNGSTARYISAVQIDGNAITPKWGGGAPIGGTSANTDMYSFNIVKTSATPTYNVFAQVSSFF